MILYHMIIEFYLGSHTTMFWAYINFAIVFNAVTAIGKLYADPRSLVNAFKSIWWVASTAAVWETETRDDFHQKLKTEEIIIKLLVQLWQAFLVASTINILPHTLPFDKPTIQMILNIIDGSFGFAAHLLLLRQLA